MLYLRTTLATSPWWEYTVILPSITLNNHDVNSRRLCIVEPSSSMNSAMVRERRQPFETSTVDATSVSTVKSWFTRFRGEDTDFKDIPWSWSSTQWKTASFSTLSKKIRRWAPSVFRWDRVHTFNSLMKNYRSIPTTRSELDSPSDSWPV